MTRVPLTHLLLLAALAALAGCDYNTYRVNFEMEANNLARATVTGRKPSMQITNDGPGAVAVQFYADKFPVGDVRRLQAGEMTAEALGGDFSATLETADEKTDVTVEVEQAGNLSVDAAKPK